MARIVKCTLCQYIMETPYNEFFMYNMIVNILYRMRTCMVGLNLMTTQNDHTSWHAILRRELKLLIHRTCDQKHS